MKKIVCLAAVVLTFGCGGGRQEEGVSGPQTDNRPYVLATTGMVADLARNVGGDHVKVEALMGAGVDPHLYKASEGDVQKMTSARLILYNGLHLEGKMGEIFEKMQSSRPVVAISSEIPVSELLADPSYPDQHDPHIWFDARLWAMAVDPVVKALSEIAPEHAEDFRQRGEAYRARVLETDSWVAARISEIPEKSRVLVTAHDAFNYFGRRYGTEVVGIQGISTVTEAGLADMKKTVDLLVSRRIKAIFVESSVPHDTVEAVQAACREKKHVVAIGGELYSDAMGADGTEEGTYIGMIRSNTDKIVNALK